MNLLKVNGYTIIIVSIILNSDLQTVEVIGSLNWSYF